MTRAIMAHAQKPSRLKKFWHDRVLGLIIAQLTQGVTPQKIALTIALGVNLGVFPVLGSTTLICAIVAFCFKLNQPVIQLVNWLMYPVQFATVLLFIRLGEWIVGAPRIPFSVRELMQKFEAAPAQFLKDFGMTAVHGIIAWFLVAPFIATLIYFILLPPLGKLAQIHKRHHQKNAR